MALLSIEVEYHGAIIATYEAILASGIEVLTPIPIYYKNISSMELAKNLVFHARTKHIEVH